MDFDRVPKERIVASEEAAESGQIVVGVDGSEPSKSALQWARRLAPALGSRVQAVIAWHYPPDIGFGWPDGWDPQVDAQRVLANTVAEVYGADEASAVDTLVSEGSATKALLDASSGAQMLIVGSRGHGGFAGLLLGSLSSACAEHAHCPVLVVHDRMQTASHGFSP
jgi:nucleotide-binding universal stress UspA family protein